MNYVSKPCSECGKPTRGQRVTIAQAPGTFIRKGTLCAKCYEKDHPRKPWRLVKEPVNDTGTRHAVIGLEGFMAERRARLARKAS